MNKIRALANSVKQFCIAASDNIRNHMESSSEEYKDLLIYALGLFVLVPLMIGAAFNMTVFFYVWFAIFLLTPAVVGILSAIYFSLPAIKSFLARYYKSIRELTAKYLNQASDSKLCRKAILFCTNSIAVTKEFLRKLVHDVQKSFVKLKSNIENNKKDIAFVLVMMAAILPYIICVIFLNSWTFVFVVSWVWTITALLAAVSLLAISWMIMDLFSDTKTFADSLINVSEKNSFVLISKFVMWLNLIPLIITLSVFFIAPYLPLVIAACCIFVLLDAINLVFPGFFLGIKNSIVSYVSEIKNKIGGMTEEDLNDIPFVLAVLSLVLFLAAMCMTPHSYIGIFAACYMLSAWAIPSVFFFFSMSAMILAYFLPVLQPYVVECRDEIYKNGCRIRAVCAILPTITSMLFMLSAVYAPSYMSFVPLVTMGLVAIGICALLLLMVKDPMTKIKNLIFGFVKAISEVVLNVCRICQNPLLLINLAKSLFEVCKGWAQGLFKPKEACVSSKSALVEIEMRVLPSKAGMSAESAWDELSNTGPKSANGLSSSAS